MAEFEESEGFKLRSGNKSSFKQMGSQGSVNRLIKKLGTI